MKSIWLAFLFLAAWVPHHPSVRAAPKTSSAKWRPALPGYRYQFPRDHGAHAAFRTEWWYFSGNLTSKSGGRYAFMLAFFRSGLRPPGAFRRPRKSRWALENLYFAHLSVLDVKRVRHRYFERMSRGALEEAGARRGGLDVWLRDWRAREEIENKVRVLKISAQDKGISLSLHLLPQKPPAVHGRSGISQKADGPGRASHYYSFTRLKALGELLLDGRRLRVSGTAWMDHEFGSNQLTKDQIGWDWLGLHLSDGRELMLYLMRKKNGGYDRNSSGTLVDADGSVHHLPLRAYRFEPTGRWRSPRSGALYPMGWRVSVPGVGIEIRVKALAKNQELETKGSTRVTYWEGAVQAEGRSKGGQVSGTGFVEMTGYADGARPMF